MQSPVPASPESKPPVTSAAKPGPPNAHGSHAPHDGVNSSALRRPRRDTLELYLMRHASAGTRRANPKLDVKRPLDKDGKRHCLQLAQVLGGLRTNFDLIISSPLKRCLQTAQLVGTELGYEAKVLHAQALEPDADYSQFERLVQECRSYESVLVVGHNPNMTAFLGRLIATNGHREAGPALAQVRLRKGALARVTVERSSATLKWLLDPRLVRALYATSTKSSRRKTSRK